MRSRASLPSRVHALLIAVAVVLPLVVGVAPASAEGGAAPTTEQMEQELIDKLNAERIEEGLEPLAVYWDLTDDARAHSQYMKESGEFHHNPNLTSVTTGWFGLGENIAIHYNIPGMHEAWMSSPGHRANILGNYNYVGVGIATNEAGSIWGTQVFMRGPEGLADPYETPAEPEPDAVFDYSSKSQLKELINHDRDERDLPRLEWHNDLGGIAKENSLRSAADGVLHDIEHIAGVENVYGLTDDGVAAWYAEWSQSEEGQAILGAELTHFGVAVAHPADLEPAKYITILFKNGELEGSGEEPYTGKDPVEDVCPENKKCDSVGVVDGGAKFKLNEEATSGDDKAGFYFGNPGDVPLMGDWNCDGKRTPGQYRARDGYVYLRNSNTAGVGEIKFFFGNPGDVPLVGDFNGDGCDTVSIHRPGSGQVFIINVLGENDGGLGIAEFSYFFGDPGDKAFAGDFNGDGVDTVGLHRETTGLVYYIDVHKSRPADKLFVFGDPGDLLLAGDWNGDGVDTPALYRPANGMLYLKLANSSGNADAAVYVGRSLAGTVRTSR